MIVTAKKLREGYQIPKWFGVAYRDPVVRITVCYPIPLHWLVRVGRSWWWKFLSPAARSKEEERWASCLAEEFDNGCRQGRLAERAHLLELTNALGMDCLPIGFLEETKPPHSA